MQPSSLQQYEKRKSFAVAYQEILGKKNKDKKKTVLSGVSTLWRNEMEDSVFIKIEDAFGKIFLALDTKFLAKTKTKDSVFWWI